MLMIRLQRMGKKKRPTYRIIINEKARDTQAKSIEILGHYSPTENPKILELNIERIKYWLSMGAQASETVHNLLVKEGVVEGKKRKSVTITNKRKTKMGAKQAEVEAKKKEAEDAKKVAKDKADEEVEAIKDAEKVQVEAPVEEVATVEPVSEPVIQPEVEKVVEEKPVEKASSESTPAEVEEDKVEKKEE